jgi:hypothetical protein
MNNEYKNKKNSFPGSIFKNLKCCFPWFPTMLYLCHNQNTLQKCIFMDLIVLFLIHYSLQISKFTSNLLGKFKMKLKKGFWVELIKPPLKRPYKMDHAKQALRPISCSKVQSNFMYTNQGWF